MLANYAFVTRETLAYFDKRPPQARRDADFALDYVKRHAQTPEQQQAVLDALEFKCDVLWSQLDALYYAYVSPGHIPPGAFVPESAMTEPSRRSDQRASAPAARRAAYTTTRRTAAGCCSAPERVFEADAISARESSSAATARRRWTQIVDDLARPSTRRAQRIADRRGEAARRPRPKRDCRMLA